MRTSTRKEFLTIPYSMVGKGYSMASMVLYGIIYKLSANGYEGCYPSNKYFGKLLDLSERQITRLISELEQKGAISIRQDENNKNLRWLKPLIATEVPYYSRVKNEGEDFEEL